MTSPSESGERILPEGWVKYVSTPSGPQPDGAFGYGASFWLLNKSEGVPPDTFAAFGNRRLSWIRPAVGYNDDPQNHYTTEFTRESLRAETSGIALFCLDFPRPVAGGAVF